MNQPNVDWEQEIEATAETWEDFLKGILHRDKNAEIEIDHAIIISLARDKEGEPFTNVDGFGEGPHLLLTQLGMMDTVMRSLRQRIEGEKRENEPEL